MEQFYSDDYAGLDVGDLHFYYGYEVEDDDGDWCFQVKRDEKQIYITTESEIRKNTTNVNKLSDVRDYLIAGIGMWLLNQNEKLLINEKIKN